MTETLHNTLKPEILNELPVPVVSQDMEHTIQWANQSYLNAVGMSLPELVGKKCFSAWGFSTPCSNCPVMTALITGEQAEADLTAGTQDEWCDTRPGWRVKAIPVRDEDGTITGAVETFLDLPGYMNQTRRQGQIMPALLRLFEFAATHTTHELLQKFLDEAEILTGSKIGFYHFVEEDQKTLSLQMWSTNTQKFCSVADPDTHYLISDAGVWVDCVRQRVPVIHNNYEKLPHKKGLPKGHVPLVRDLVVPVLRNEKLVAILGVGNKETYYEGHDAVLVGQLAELAWETVVRKRSEDEYKKLQEQYRQSQKMESIGRLAGGVAHDYNNMLNVILGNADIALDQLDATDSSRSYLLEICNAAERSANLTSQLLAFARRQAISLEILNLNDVVSNMIKMINLLIGEDIELAWRPHKNLVLVEMDPGQIEQLLANLCVNARDAITRVGKVTIETHQVELDETYTHEHPEFLPGQYAMLVVSDNGCGMERETLTNIFEPFFTTKNEGEGTGLGLATVYGIVKQNKGFINVYSEPGQGTTFKIYLPLYKNNHKSPPISRVETDAPKGDSETVLLVEDEAMILNLCKKMLMQLGYNVLTAETPEDGLRLAAEHDKAIDLLLTDIVMPGMNGRELAGKIGKIHEGINTLYMSGYTAEVIANQGVLQEGVHFIQKPFMKKELAVKIREAIAQK